MTRKQALKRIDALRNRVASGTVDALSVVTVEDNGATLRQGHLVISEEDRMMCALVTGHEIAKMRLLKAWPGGEWWLASGDDSSNVEKDAE